MILKRYQTLSDDEITKYDDKSLFLYLESQNYPEQCSIYQYDLSITDQSPEVLRD